MMTSASKSQKTVWLMAAAFGLGAWAINLLYIQFPSGVNYDEAHYVPAARELLQGRVTNAEHPPLGKWLIASSIAVFGDHPAGWRMLSALFGALSVSATCLIAWMLFFDLGLAGMASLLTLFNLAHYVQSRIAMLDTFMMTFSLWGLVCLLGSLDTSLKSRKLGLEWASATLFGLSLACKWSAFFIAVPLLMGAGLLAHQEHRNVWRTVETTAKWTGVIFGVYFLVLTPLPLLFRDFSYSLTHLFDYQLQMFRSHAAKLPEHLYSSQPWQWALLLRPIWYQFAGSNESASFRGVLFLLNPAIAWTGLISILVCIGDAFKTRSRPGVMISLFYLGTFLGWCLLPRSLSFFYYYYPCIMALSFAVPHSFRVYPRLATWGAAFVVLLLARGFSMVGQDASPFLIPSLGGIAALVAALIPTRISTAKLAGGSRAEWVYTCGVILLFFYFFPLVCGLKWSLDTFWPRIWFSTWI